MKEQVSSSEAMLHCYTLHSFTDEPVEMNNRRHVSWMRSVITSSPALLLTAWRALSAFIVSACLNWPSLMSLGFWIRATIGTDSARRCSSDSNVCVMEWREQSAVSCDEAYLEAQRWIEVSKTLQNYQSSQLLTGLQRWKAHTRWQMGETRLATVCDHHMVIQGSGVFVCVFSL